MPNISKSAIQFVKLYEERAGRRVIDVQTNGKFKGFDLFSFSRENEEDIRTIEVKGTKSANGIPDCYETEFTKNKRLIATHMYVVSFYDPQKPILYKIPANAFKPEHLKEVIHYKIGTAFTNTLEMYKA